MRSAASHMLAVAMMLSLTGSCRQRERPAPEQRPPGVPAPLTFGADAQLVFIYADMRGMFHNTMGVQGVPQASRHVVRVIDPTVKAADRGDYRYVHMVDLSALDNQGTFVTRPVLMQTFEQRALAALPPGAASRVQIPGSGQDLAGIEVKPHDRIIIYGTSWCGACKQARAFFRDRHLAFDDYDIENEPKAAGELAVKAAAAGIRPDRVPIIDVRGRLLVGFDQGRLETLLGDPI